MPAEEEKRERKNGEEEDNISRRKYLVREGKQNGEGKGREYLGEGKG